MRRRNTFDLTLAGWDRIGWDSILYIYKTGSAGVLGIHAFRASDAFADILYHKFSYRFHVDS